ncbi:MAG: metal-sensing transcriptional repressor [Stappiaceae bacterium]
MIHESHPDILKRLKRAEGHLKKTIAMVEAADPCPAIAQQLHAVEAAVRKAKQMLIHDHIDHCLEDALTETRGAGDVLGEFKEISKYL